MHRDHHFFHWHSALPGAATEAEGATGGLAFTLAAYAHSSVRENDQKCDYGLDIDPAYVAAEPTPPWFAQVKSISSKGMAFALFDQSDDAYGRKTGKPRRELGILSYSYAAPTASHEPVPLQLVVPLAQEEGTAEQFIPDAPERSMAAAYQAGDRSRMLTLNGLANVNPGGEIELHLEDETPVFEAHVREAGNWAVKYRWPLSSCQACAIALSILHNPRTQQLDHLPPKMTDRPSAEQLSAQAAALAAESSAAIGRAGSLKESHERYYKPKAEKLTAEAVESMLAAYPGSPEDFTSGLGEVLAKVGLGDRLDGALKWAAERRVGSLGAMLGLLQLQDTQWGTLLAAVGPTKSFHRMRLQVQLKKMTEGGKKVAQTSTDLYWAKVDGGPSEGADAADDIEEEPA